MRSVLTVEQEPLWAWQLIRPGGTAVEATTFTGLDGFTPSSVRSTDPGLMYGAVQFTVAGIRDSDAYELLNLPGGGDG